MIHASDKSTPPSPEEIKESIAAAKAFLDEIEAVPESERVPMVSAKFYGAVGLPDAST